ncbi:hypothetical protein BH20CHL6_BH20CHL6_13680 [soil metagenome]
MTGRSVRLVLVTPDGEPLGMLAPFPVATPWWQDAEPIVCGARQHHGVELTVLRVLEGELPSPPGGSVTYLAEVTEPVAAEPWPGHLDEHRLRQSWARPGGPTADLTWALTALRERNLQLTGPPEQVRSWNLSSLWRLPTAGQTAWLKVVPPFFAHEGELLARLQGGPVPALLAHDGGRVLLAEIAGEDLYEAQEPLRSAMVTMLVDLQAKWMGRVDELLALNLPDWRGPALAEAIGAVVERVGPELSGRDRKVLSDFVACLEGRLVEVGACGLPDTLVHGDFHPGNLRGDGSMLVLLDWGDSGIGHPLLDESAFLDRIPGDAVASVREHWHSEWRRAVPGSQPERAAELLAPVAAARQAVIYQHFLDNIEPSEHAYHRRDPQGWLGRAAALLHATA